MVAISITTTMVSTGDVNIVKGQRDEDQST